MIRTSHFSKIKVKMNNSMKDKVALKIKIIYHKVNQIFDDDLILRITLLMLKTS